LCKNTRGHMLCVRLNREVAITESPKPRRLVLAPLQRLRRRPITADSAAGHVTEVKVLPVIVERSSADCLVGGRRTETLLDAMHKKFYPDQYGVAGTGSDVRTSATRGEFVAGGTRRTDDSAECRSATTTTTTSIVCGDSRDGATGRASPNHATGNVEIDYDLIELQLVVSNQVNSLE